MAPNLVERLYIGIGENRKTECMVNNVPDPFFQLKVLYLLCSLCNNNQIWIFGDGMSNVLILFVVHFLRCLYG